MAIAPYLFFEGRCEEAIGFYRTALGAEVTMLMRFSDAPPGDGPNVPPEHAHNIMHGELRIGDATVLVSDGFSSGTANFAGFGLSLYAHDAAEADRFFAALSEGGQVRMPLGKTFFAEKFGMVADRFGVAWMVVLNAR